MTVTVQPARTAADVVTAFFDAYRRQDVNEMVSYCTENAGFEYVPFEAWGKQKVLRGDGKVRTIGKTIWTGLITAFPDLTNEVLSISSNDQGEVVAEVVIGGTQAAAWANMAPRGKRYDEPHLFIMTVTPDGLIDHITCYWNGAGISVQLGHYEVD